MLDPTLHPDDSVLNEYLDGELGGSVQADLEAHLSGCKDCARRLAEMETLFQRIESLPDEAPPHDLSGAVVEALRKPSASPNQPWVFAAGAVLELILSAAALIWLVPAAAWRSLPGGMGPAFQPPSLQFLVERMSLSGLAGPVSGILESLQETWLGWVNASGLLWQTIRAGLAQAVQVSGQTGLSQAPLLELGLVGLAGTLVWLAGNGLLIGSLNRKSRRRNS
jgi:anti-sigma factor RsiW